MISNLAPLFLFAAPVPALADVTEADFSQMAAACSMLSSDFRNSQQDVERLSAALQAQGWVATQIEADRTALQGPSGNATVWLFVETFGQGQLPNCSFSVSSIGGEDIRALIEASASYLSKRFGTPTSVEEFFAGSKYIVSIQNKMIGFTVSKSDTGTLVNAKIIFAPEPLGDGSQ